LFRVFKILRKSFGSCIPARRSKGIEDPTDDVVHPDAMAPVDDEVKDRDDVVEDEVAANATVKSSSSPKAELVDAPEDEDTPVATMTRTADEEEETSPMAEERDGSPEDPPAETLETAASREAVQDFEPKPPVIMEVEEPEQAQDFRWELSCCGVDIPLSK
jgi:hypothetical protein